MADKAIELTDEMAASIWSGSTASIAGFEEPEQVDDTNSDDEVKVIDTSKAKPVDEAALAAALRGEELEEDEDEEDDELEEEPKVEPKVAPKTGGRKPSDPIKFINELVESKILDGFEDGLPTTIEEAKALIKANIEDKRQEAIDNAFELKKASYSPQIQTILDYAEKGIQSASELMELIGAIKEVEDVNDFDTSTDEGAEAVVREAYKAKGFKDSYIDKNVKRLKDLDALKEEADELSQELVAIKAGEVKKRLQAQAQREEQAMEASKVYFKTIQDTLAKETISGVKLAKEDKAKIYQALADDRYTSLSGGKTNGFIKTLEDLQFGKTADYEHFLSIVQHAVDPKGFLEKMKASVKAEVTADTVRKLKTSRSNTQNTQDDAVQDAPVRRTVKRETFVNPYK
jgi:hypothetical protein